MRCLTRAICNKIKRLVLLYITIGVLIIILIFFVNHRLALLNYYATTTINVYKQRRNYPGDFLEDYRRSNETYCNFMYNLPEKFTYEQDDVQNTPDLGVDSPYRVLYNVIKAKQNLTNIAAVTYVTHITPDFVSYISEVVRYWEGPVSIAAFVPDSDADILTKQLIRLCQCLPSMSKVSMHYVFPKQYTPYVGKIVEPFSTKCRLLDLRNFITFRNKKGLIYPVNVSRNVARNASATNFVLVSDIELIPSNKLASKFLRMISKLVENRFANFKHRVFVVPVFEVDSYEYVPRRKSDLIQLIRREKAVYFHQHICSHCQKFPGLEKWLSQNSGNAAKMLEMCLIGYRFLILDGAFLVHWPGIKQKSSETKNTNKWRYPHQLWNSRQYTNIVKKLSKKYTNNPKCKVQ
ncbi:hypothetical protein FQA39_LY16929 [Lamprigera yunnana]|nr:hypothetical protein FQA39_LY16929 [Lamprigera yunnana]